MVFTLGAVTFTLYGLIYLLGFILLLFLPWPRLHKLGSFYGLNNQAGQPISKHQQHHVASHHEGAEAEYRAYHHKSYEEPHAASHHEGAEAEHRAYHHESYDESHDTEHEPNSADLDKPCAVAAIASPLVDGGIAHIVDSPQSLVLPSLAEAGESSSGTLVATPIVVPSRLALATPAEFVGVKSVRLPTEAVIEKLERLPAEAASAKSERLPPEAASAKSERLPPETAGDKSELASEEIAAVWSTAVYSTAVLPAASENNVDEKPQASAKALATASPQLSTVAVVGSPEASAVASAKTSVAGAVEVLAVATVASAQAPEKGASQAAEKLSSQALADDSVQAAVVGSAQALADSSAQTAVAGFSEMAAVAVVTSPKVLSGYNIEEKSLVAVTAAGLKRGVLYKDQVGGAGAKEIFPQAAPEKSSYSTSWVALLWHFNRVLYLALGAIIGARLFYVLAYDYSYYQAYPQEIWALHHGGMAYHGALLGLLFVLICFRPAYRYVYADRLALVALLMIPLGRLANFYNAELLGIPTTMPWGIIFSTAPDLLPRHPVQLYEAIAEGPLSALVIAVLLGIRRLWRLPYQAGLISVLYLLCYSLGRFICEFWRAPDSQIGYLWGQLTQGQYLCIGQALLGLIFWRLLTWRYQQHELGISHFLEK